MLYKFQTDCGRQYSLVNTHRSVQDICTLINLWYILFISNQVPVYWCHNSQQKHSYSIKLQCSPSSIATLTVHVALTLKISQGEWNLFSSKCRNDLSLMSSRHGSRGMRSVCPMKHSTLDIVHWLWKGNGFGRNSTFASGYMVWKKSVGVLAFLFYFYFSAKSFNCADENLIAQTQ